MSGLLLLLAGAGAVVAALARAAHKAAHRLRYHHTFAAGGRSWLVWYCSCGWGVVVPANCPYPKTVAGHEHREHVRNVTKP